MKTRVFLLTLILILVEARFAQVSASPVTVHEHYFAKSIVVQAANWRPANVSSSFTQDDAYVYAYTNASFAVSNFTWKWYDPSGALYTSWNETHTCETRFCRFYTYMELANHTSADRIGKWRMDLLADGVLLYSDHFTLLPVIEEENYWYFDLYSNQPQSGPLRAHVNLTVTIHPDNVTWSGYSVRMPYAANITAYEFGTNRPLQVVTRNDSSVIVEFGAQRRDGYKFTMSFDLASGFESHTDQLSDRYYRDFNLTWYEYVGVHPVPQDFTVVLPSGCTLVHVMAPANYTTELIRSENRHFVSFNMTAPPDQVSVWSILFQNMTLLPTPQAGYSVLAMELPILPLTVGDVGIWAGIMALILLTTGELLSPRYARTDLVINRKRLRAVAFVVTIILLATILFVVYKILVGV